MVQIDVLTGEDVRKVQRQQYENWFKQQIMWTKERSLRDEMEKLDGKRRQGAIGGRASDDYKNLLNAGLKTDTLTTEELEVSATLAVRVFFPSQGFVSHHADGTERHLCDWREGLRQHRDTQKEGLAPGLCVSVCLCLCSWRLSALHRIILKSILTMAAQVQPLRKRQSVPDATFEIKGEVTAMSACKRMYVVLRMAMQIFLASWICNGRCMIGSEPEICSFCFRSLSSKPVP